MQHLRDYNIIIILWKNSHTNTMGAGQLGFWGIALKITRDKKIDGRARDNYLIFRYARFEVTVFVLSLRSSPPPNTNNRPTDRDPVPITRPRPLPMCSTCT